MKHERVTVMESCIARREADGVAAKMNAGSPDDWKDVSINRERKEWRGVFISCFEQQFAPLVEAAAPENLTLCATDLSYHQIPQRATLARPKFSQLVLCTSLLTLRNGRAHKLPADMLVCSPLFLWRDWLWQGYWRFNTVVQFRSSDMMSFSHYECIAFVMFQIISIAVCRKCLPKEKATYQKGREGNIYSWSKSVKTQFISPILVTAICQFRHEHTSDSRDVQRLWELVVSCQSVF